MEYAKFSRENTEADAFRTQVEAGGAGMLGYWDQGWRVKIMLVQAA